jgi:ATP-dependent RNA helicase DeaD
MNPEKNNSFADFGLDPTILMALEKMNFKVPSPIQAQAIPLIQQKKDLIALAQTGSGKTATCAIPICNRVDVNRTHIQALIVVPTRELALQYATEAQKIGLYKKVSAFGIYGGESADLQQSKLRHGVQVLVATPGRLIDFIYSRQIDLSHVETLILDEADEMLSMGFSDDLHFIIQCLVHPHQTLLFSATMPPGIRQLAKQYMNDPQEVSLIQEASPSSIEHFFLYCQHGDRDRELNNLVAKMQPKQGIIFCQSRLQVEQVWRALKKHYDGVDFLHAGLGQDVRTIVTGKFRSGKVRLLVATDIVARGLDFSQVSHVFIYQLPADPDAYIHRTGRTGRHDKKGVAVSLVTQRELPFLKTISHKLKQDLNWIGSPPSPPKKTAFHQAKTGSNPQRES